MTTPSGNIVFNSSTGSDSGTSGLGPATAATGSGAGTTASSAVVTGLDTSTLSAGDLLYVNSTSGIKFSIIASVDDSSTVTTDATWDNTESGLTWACGGKRATFDDADSRLIFTSGSATDWDIETETDQTITSSITFNRQISVRGSTGAEEILAGYNGTMLESASNTYLTDIKLRFTLTTGTSRWAFRATGSQRYVFNNVHITEADDGMLRGANTPFAIWFNCSISNCDRGMALVPGQTYLVNCTFSDCTSYGMQGNTANNGKDRLYGCIFYNNTGTGCLISNDAYVHNCVFYGNGSYGLLINSNDADGNLFTNNVSYGNTSNDFHTSATGASFTIFTGNAYQNSNTDFDNLIASAICITEGNVSLTADPFVDGANGDFSLNDAAGGGALLKDSGIAFGPADASTQYYFNHLASTAGGGGFNRIGLNGGING